MDQKIAILAPDVVNQIAAGEVVERPASVVKELVENSLDAGAGRIGVEIRGGGRDTIRVVDDGKGMTPEDALLSLERHATSKLRAADDLVRIHTMGFRGEALSSIASVSRMTLVTRTRDSDVGRRILSEGGDLRQDEPAGARPGTSVEVADIFFNTPARNKFLKSTATETGHITDTVGRISLSAPEVHFTLTQDGRQVLDLPPCKQYLERDRAVLGRQGRRLISAQHAREGIQVEASLGPPEGSLKTARSVILVVNRRFIRDRPLVHAVVAGYGGLLERGRYPAAVMHLELNPTFIDVNVHPQKTEIRFDDPRKVFAAVRRCVYQAVAASPWMEMGAAGDTARTYQIKTSSGENSGYEQHKRRIEQAAQRFWSTPSRPSTTHHAASEPLLHYRPGGPPPHPGSSEVMDPGEASLGGFFSGLRVVGQVMGTYLVCEGSGEVILLDQHAAHERVTYEGLRRGMREEAITSQRLLIPATVSLDPALEAAAKTHQQTLDRLGFDLEDFGGGSWTIRAVPALLRSATPGDLVTDVLEELAQGGETEVVSAALDAVLARMACHGSVRAGRLMGEGEIRALLISLDRVDFSAACPHGRPVMMRLPRSELERRLGRS